LKPVLPHHSAESRSSQERVSGKLVTEYVAVLKTRHGAENTTKHSGAKNQIHSPFEFDVK
jgi:hypothetical protein